MSSTPAKPKPGGLAFLIPILIWIAFSIGAVVLAVQGVQRAEDTFDNFARLDVDRPSATLKVRVFDRDGEPVEVDGRDGDKTKENVLQLEKW